MSSKAELEAAVPPGTAAAEIKAQIAALQARLHESITYDPAFTPAELVRWDPSLIGTAFRIQHERNIPANAFKQVMRSVPLPPNSSFIGDYTAVVLDPTNTYGSSDVSLPDHCIGNGDKLINSDAIMEMIGVLKPTGIYHTTCIYYEDGAPPTKTWYFTISNKFNSITLLSLLPGACYETSNTINPKYNLSCKELGIYLNIQDAPYSSSKKIYNWILPLANPDRLLLDQIYIATSTRIHDKDVITDKYPLSTLYQEWKRDKTAGRMHRRSPLDEAMDTIRALQEELRLAREARAAADAHSEKLRAALHASVGIKESENPV
jgi:hypothetical protein